MPLPPNCRQLFRGFHWYNNTTVDRNKAVEFDFTTSRDHICVHPPPVPRENTVTPSDQLAVVASPPPHVLANNVVAKARQASLIRYLHTYGPTDYLLDKPKQTSI